MGYVFLDGTDARASTRDLVGVQLPANVRAKRSAGGGERGEQTTRVEGANEVQRGGREQDGAARGRGAGRRRETHIHVSFVSWPNPSGTVPLIMLPSKYLQ